MAMQVFHGASMQHILSAGQALTGQDRPFTWHTWHTQQLTDAQTPTTALVVLQKRQPLLLP